jgi:hypothetical protein
MQINMEYCYYYFNVIIITLILLLLLKHCVTIWSNIRSTENTNGDQYFLKSTFYRFPYIFFSAVLGMTFLADILLLKK